MLTAWVKLQDWMRWLRGDDEGQGITEYVLILALVVVALLAVINFTGLGDALGTAISNVTGEVNDAASGSMPGS